MKIKSNNGNFEPCPEYTGRAVCADVTPLKKWDSKFGQQDVFKIVFEIDRQRADGSYFCAWSRNFTPSLNEKANLRKFLKGWFGRDLTKQEMEEFDTETLIGKTANIVIIHEHKDGEVYANIVACTPDKSNNPLKLCGKYVRLKDRPPKDGGGDSGYRRAESTSPVVDDGASVKVHVGRCQGLELRDLSVEQVNALVSNWLPQAKMNANPSADDRRLIAALDGFIKREELAADNCPF